MKFNNAKKAPDPVIVGKFFQWEIFKGSFIAISKRNFSNIFRIPEAEIEILEANDVKTGSSIRIFEIVF